MSPHLIQKAHYELFPYHTDIGIRGVGWNEPEAFEQAALALSSMTVNPDQVQDVDAVWVHCQAASHPLLLLDWLNTLIYEAGARRMAFGRFRVRLFDHQLEGVAWGEKIENDHYKPVLEPKGAIHSELSIAQEIDGRWIVQCVIDV